MPTKVKVVRIQRSKKDWKQRLRKGRAPKKVKKTIHTSTPKRTAVKIKHRRPVSKREVIHLEPIPIGDIMIKIPNITREDILPSQTRTEAWVRRQKAFERMKNIKEPLSRYREVFESCYIRYALSLGLCGELDELDIFNTDYTEEEEAILGTRNRIKLRLNSSKELFDKLENSLVTEDNISTTEYFGTFIDGARPKKVLSRAKNAYQLLKKMETAGSFIGSAGQDKYYPTDFPQAVYYWGYRKDLDGTHRRMAMHHLGHTSVPSLIIDSEKIEENKLPEGYIRKGWLWFANEMRWGLKIDIPNKDIEREIETLAPWYQCIDVGHGKIVHNNASQLIVGRTEDMLPHLLPKLHKEDSVLDIGCNAGLYSVLSGAICKSATGIEVAERFARQACWTRRQWEQANGKSLDNVHFLIADIQDNLHLIDSCSVLLIPKIFHHKKFNPKKIAEFMTRVANSRVRLVFLQGHTQRGQYGKQDYLNKLLKSYGFTTRVAIDQANNDFPLIIGERDI
jgi:SAM-dependent methyltransferase